MTSGGKLWRWKVNHMGAMVLNEVAEIFGAIMTDYFNATFFLDIEGNMRHLFALLFNIISTNIITIASVLFKNLYFEELKNFKFLTQKFS